MHLLVSVLEDSHHQSKTQITTPFKRIGIRTTVGDTQLLLCVQYGEFRSGYGHDTSDTRIVFYGLRYILETYLLRQWTREDVEKSEKFYR